jgi:isoaspartyl peptidase/L-asparaginase-like protein (Ntn-hydrolase superfamily)
MREIISRKFSIVIACEQVLLEGKRDSGNIRSSRSMNRMNPKRLAVFVSVFAVVAIAICAVQSAKKQQRALENAQQQRTMQVQAAAQKAAQDVAAQKAQYLARYVNVGISQKPAGKTIAIAAADENGTLSRAVTAALEKRFQREPALILSPFFKPEFVSDGLFKDAFTGSGDVFNKLELANSLNEVVLAQQDVQYAQNAALENVISATMQLKVAVMPISGQSNGKTWTFTAYGPGFTKEVARQAAEERLIKQITTDTNMSLINH